MKRFATLIVLAAGLAAGVAVASAVAAAHVGTTTSSTSTTGTSTSTTSTTSTTPPVVVETKFPAAGQLAVHHVVVRRQPAPHASAIKVFHYFRPDFRPQEILAIGAKIGADGQPWYHVSVPMRPNGTYGWIPATSVDLAPTVSQIVVDVSSRTIDVYRRGKHMLHAQVAVGAPGRETPLGRYYVTATFDHPSSFLGVYALETSAYSKLTDWPGGGVVGIHGTDEPWLLGQAVSHGCVRVANATAAALKRLTPLGTPIFIKA